MKRKGKQHNILIEANLYLNDLPIIVREYKNSVRITFTDGEMQVFTKKEWEEACYAAMENEVIREK